MSILSNYNSPGSQSVGKAKRDLCGLGPEKTPGPGKYMLPSDFGHYQSKTLGDERVKYV